MAHTDVTLINAEGVYVPSADSVSVTSGDTVSFKTSDGKIALAFFSPDAVAAISPSPVNPVSIKGQAQFSFATSAAGAYLVFFGTDPTATAPSFRGEHSQLLLLRTIGDAPPFNFNPLNTGH
ncbi:MAG TPA: hypothetical protein VGG85_07620 [Terracidiphilus sp.]